MRQHLLHRARPGMVMLALLTLVVALAGVAPAGRAAAATTGTFTDLGPQVRAITIHKGAVGTDATGRPLVYAVVYGDAASATEPGTFVVMDLNTRQVVKSFPLAGQTGAWAITVDDANRKVTIGTYRGGRVYRYDPDTQTLTNLGAPVPGAVVLYGMSAGRSGAVYGGTYPGAGVFAASGTGTLYNLGTAWSGETHALSTTLKMDGGQDLLYIGTGGTGRLVRYNLGTGAKTDILPTAFGGEKEVYDLNYVGGRLIAKMHPSLTAAVLHPDTGAADTLTNGDTGQTGTTFPIGSRGVSPLAPDGRSVYYTDSNGLSRLDLTTKTFYDVKDSSGATINLQGSAIAWGWVTLNDPDYPGLSLVGLAGNYDGKAFRYNPSTGKHEVFTLPYPKLPTDIYHVTAGPDGKVYSGSYINGSVGVHDPATGGQAQYPGLGQVEGWTNDGGLMYIGTYPEGKVRRYDPAQPWNAGESPGNNPGTLFSLKSAYNQNRPQALAVLDGQLYAGSVPYSGSTGALSRYDLATGALTVNTQDFSGRSVASLAVHQGVLWGGTAGGPNGAELFRVDAATGRVAARYVPISGGKRMGALVSGPFGKLWGVVDATLFVFDPATNTFTHLGGLPGSNGDASGAGIVWHPNGQIYAVSGGQLYQVDPPTKAKTALRTSGVWRLARQGDDLYFKDGTATHSGIRLWRYTP